MNQNNAAKKISVPRLLLACAIPLGVGGLASLIAGNTFEVYEGLTKPPLAPPGFFFPVIWSVLYILMGIASYLIFEKRSADSRKALTLYAFYLVLNLLWPKVFFERGAFLAALFLLVAQILMLFACISAYTPLDKRAALLLVPTVAWSIFALYLNGGFLYLNA